MEVRVAPEGLATANLVVRVVAVYNVEVLVGDTMTAETDVEPCLLAGMVTPIPTFIWKVVQLSDTRFSVMEMVIT